MDNSTYLNEEAKSYIEGIRQTKNRMKSRFEDFNDIMKKLSSGNAFVGSAGSTFFQKYDTLKKEYAYFEDLFESFAKDFQQAVEATEATNKIVEESASSISDVK